MILVSNRVRTILTFSLCVRYITIATCFNRQTMISCSEFNLIKDTKSDINLPSRKMLSTLGKWAEQILHHNRRIPKGTVPQTKHCAHSPGPSRSRRARLRWGRWRPAAGSPRTAPPSSFRETSTRSRACPPGCAGSRRGTPGFTRWDRVVTSLVTMVTIYIYLVTQCLVTTLRSAKKLRVLAWPILWQSHQIEGW